MIRSKLAAAGFNRLDAPVASARLTHAVAASLVLAALSLCLSVGFALVSISASVAAPIVG